MTIPSAEHQFSFESSFDSNEPRDRAFKRTSKLGVSEEIIFVVFGLLSGLLLFWKYTIALGAVMLAVTTFLWSIFERSREESKTIREGRAAGRTTPCRRDGEGILGAGRLTISLKQSWGAVFNGFETNGYLLVQSLAHAAGVPPRSKRCGQAGVYDQIKAIVDARSAEIKSKRAEAMAAANT